MLSDYIYDTEVNGIVHKTCMIEGETHLDEPALNYMLYNEQEFLKFNVNKSDGQMIFLYQIPEYMTVYEYIQGKLTRRQMMELISEVCTFAINIMENHVRLGYVVWDWNYIYFNTVQNKLQFILVPSEIVSGAVDEVINLIRFMIAYAKYDLIENCHYVAVILSVLNGNKDVKDTLKELIKVIKKLSVENVMRKKKETVKNIDVSNSEKLTSIDIAKRSWGDFMDGNKKENGTERPPIPCLIRLKTKETIQLYKDKFVLGKEEDKVDYTITDNPAVSRVHAFIEKKNGAFHIRDNNSSNKTYVNGNPISCEEDVLLINGAVLSLANEEFIYKIM